MAEDRKRGAVDRINSGVDAFRKARSAYKLARTAGTAAEVVSTSEIWIPIAIVIVIILIFVILIIGTTGGGATDLGGTNPAPGGGSPGSGNISSCQLTRAGQGYSIKSSILAGWINDAANRVGVPPSVLASVAMHENLSFVANAEDIDSRIATNRFCNEGAVFCERAGQSLHPGSCSIAELAGGAQNARAVGLMQIVDVFHPGEDLCSITESLSIAAQKLKADGITTAQPTQDQINIAIERYYNSCTYGSYSYCDEVWQDYQSCQAPAIADASSCPIPNGVITCGSKNKPVNNCGHCGLNYGADNIARYCGFDGTKYAMDIGGADLSPVYLPKISGNVIRWTFVSEDQGTEAIQRYTGVDELTHEQYFISFHHTQSGSGNPGTHFSGDIGAKICGNGCNERHVHVEFQIGSQGNYVDAPDYFCKE